MNTIEAVLASDRSLRHPSSHIVNIRRLAQLWSIAHGQYVIELSRVIACNRAYSERIRRALTKPF